MSIAATKAGYGSNVLVLKYGYYSGKLLHGKSEVLHLWPSFLYTSMFNYSIKKEIRDQKVQWQLPTRNLNWDNGGKYCLEYSEGKSNDVQGELHKNIKKKQPDLPLKRMER